jgi:hypothetical protein
LERWRLPYGGRVEGPPASLLRAWEGTWVLVRNCAREHLITGSPHRRWLGVSLTGVATDGPRPGVWCWGSTASGSWSSQEPPRGSASTGRSRVVCWRGNCADSPDASMCDVGHGSRCAAAIERRPLSFSPTPAFRCPPGGGFFLSWNL